MHSTGVNAALINSRCSYWEIKVTSALPEMAIIFFTAREREILRTGSSLVLATDRVMAFYLPCGLLCSTAAVYDGRVSLSKFSCVCHLHHHLLLVTCTSSSTCVIDMPCSVYDRANAVLPCFVALLTILNSMAYRVKANMLFPIAMYLVSRLKKKAWDASGQATRNKLPINWHMN